MQIATGRSPARTGRLSALSARKPLLLAIAFGLAAALLSWQYVQHAAQARRQAALVPVLVAATDIPVRTEVTPQMLAVKQVPADARHPKALTAVEQAAGKVASLPISAGEQVLSTKFFTRAEDSGLAFRVPPGRRAVSVGVSELISSGGLINPGDFVDVIGIFSNQSDGAASPDGAAGQDVATVVLQNIEVLAVAQSIQGPAESAGLAANLPGSSRPDPTKQEAVARPSARTATLAVTPEEAEKLILAEEKGKIRLALRSTEDHEILTPAAVTLRDLRR